MKKLKIALVAFFSLGLTVLLSGCKAVVLQPRGSVSLEEKHLFVTAISLMLLVVVPVIILTIFIAIRYRAGNKKSTYAPDFTHSALLEFVWWMVPIVIIAILATITWITTHQLDPYKPLDVKGKPLTIQVVALRWKWLFIYPDQKIATVDYVKFPVHRQVRFLITSDAPMNSFQIPALAGQIYAMNGMQTKLHIYTKYKGVYNGRSVSFSGQGFSNMKFKAYAVTPQDFTQWVSTVQHSSVQLTQAAYQKLAQPSKADKPLFFSSPANGLFEHIIHSYMKPSDRHSTPKGVTGVSL